MAEGDADEFPAGKYLRCLGQFRFTVLCAFVRATCTKYCSKMHSVDLGMYTIEENRKLVIRDAEDADVGRHRAELASTLATIASIAVFVIICAYIVYFTGISGKCCGFGLIECESVPELDSAAFCGRTCSILNVIFYMSLSAIIGLFIAATGVTCFG